MQVGRLAGGRVGNRQRRGIPQRGGEGVHVERVDEHAGAWRDELGRAADRRPDDGATAGERLERGLAERLDEARLAEHVRRGEVERHRVVREVAGDGDPGPSFELRPQRAIADEGQRPLAEPVEGLGEPDDVLPFDQRADAEEGGARAGRALEQPEPLQVDAAVHDLGLRRGRTDRRDEPLAQPLGDRDHRSGLFDNPPRRWADEWILGQVGDVLAVRGDDERRARRARREQRAEPRREEKMRVDDVGPEAPRRPDRAGRQPCVAKLRAAAPVEHDAFELVPTGRKCPLEALDEDPKVRRRGRGIHLGDEQNPHRRII